MLTIFQVRNSRRTWLSASWVAEGWEDPFPRRPYTVISGVLGAPWPLFLHVALSCRAPPWVLEFAEYVDLRVVALFNDGWSPKGKKQKFPEKLRAVARMDAATSSVFYWSQQSQDPDSRGGDTGFSS